MVFGGRLLLAAAATGKRTEADERTDILGCMGTSLSQQLLANPFLYINKYKIFNNWVNLLEVKSRIPKVTIG